jgi:hypothetical protein
LDKNLIVLEDKKDPVFIYNPSDLELSLSQYIPYKKKEYNEEDMIPVFHNLDNMSSNAVCNVPAKEINLEMEKFYQGNQSLLKSRRVDSIVVKNNDLSLSADSMFTTGTRSSLLLHNSSSRKSLLKSSTSAARSSFKTFPFPYEKFFKNIQVSDVGNSSIFDAVDKMDYKTLNSQFLNSEEIIAKAIKIKKKKNENKTMLSDNYKQVNKIFNYDSETKTRKFIEWSGEDVLQMELKEENFDNYNEIIKKLEFFNIIIWPDK